MWRRVCLALLMALFVVPMAVGTHANAANLNNFADKEQELLRLTNQFRSEQGLRPLEPDPALMALAREHAKAMARQGYISHTEPAGDVFIRLNRVGYNYETARENVATSRTITYAHGALLKSPGHKANILATDVTRVGIGVAMNPNLCGQYLFIAEVFAYPRDNYNPAQVKELVTAQVEGLKETSLIAASLDPLLDDIANRSLSSLSDAYSREDLRALLAQSAGELQKNGKDDISRLEVSVQVLSSPEKVSIPAAIQQGLAGIYGAAVRRIQKDSGGRPSFMVLLLVGLSR